MVVETERGLFLDCTTSTYCTMHSPGKTSQSLHDLLTVSLSSIIMQRLTQFASSFQCSQTILVFSSPLSTVHVGFSQLQDRYRTTSFRDDKSGRHSSTTDQSRQTSILNRRPFCLEQLASIS